MHLADHPVVQQSVYLAAFWPQKGEADRGQGGDDGRLGDLPTANREPGVPRSYPNGSVSSRSTVSMAMAAY
jgi:hypothetical protein